MINLINSNHDLNLYYYNRLFDWCTVTKNESYIRHNHVPVIDRPEYELTQNIRI